jgi:hypothetical protein
MKKLKNWFDARTYKQVLELIVANLLLIELERMLYDEFKIPPIIHYAISLIILGISFAMLLIKFFEKTINGEFDDYKEFFKNEYPEIKAEINKTEINETEKRNEK